MHFEGRRRRKTRLPLRTNDPLCILRGSHYIQHVTCFHLLGRVVEQSLGEVDLRSILQLIYWLKRLPFVKQEEKGGGAVLLNWAGPRDHHQSIRSAVRSFLETTPEKSGFSMKRCMHEL